MIDIHICTFGFRSTDGFLEDFAAADAPNVTWHLFLHSQRPAVVKVCEELAERSNVIYYPYGINRGMAVSLNEGFIHAQRLGAQVAMMMTDDILAGSGDIQHLAEAILDRPECAWIDGNCFVEVVKRWEPSQLDCSALSLRAFEHIGYFDRNFWPINFEDTDWKRRATLAGFTHATLPDTHFVHREFNKQIATQAEKDERAVGFGKTRDYYTAKWGGDQGAERFGSPFNEPVFDLKIATGAINDPYPGYNRTDIEAGIVDLEKVL